MRLLTPRVKPCCAADVPENGGGRTRFRWLTSVPSFYAQPAPSGMRCTRLAPIDRQLAIRPERGTAVVHFPATTPESGGYTDRNASHESEELCLVGVEKWVCQQFLWSHPIAPDALAGTTEPPQPLDSVVL